VALSAFSGGASAVKEPDALFSSKKLTTFFSCRPQNTGRQRRFTVKTRNSPGDEIANVNFLYDDIVHVIQNTIDSCINTATGRRGYVLERMCLPNSVK